MTGVQVDRLRKDGNFQTSEQQFETIQRLGQGLNLSSLKAYSGSQLQEDWLGFYHKIMICTYKDHDMYL